MPTRRIGNQPVEVKEIMKRGLKPMMSFVGHKQPWNPASFLKNVDSRTPVA
jgi:hypothetical protein